MWYVQRGVERSALTNYYVHRVSLRNMFLIFIGLSNAALYGKRVLFHECNTVDIG